MKQNKILKKNLKALNQVNPPLHKWLTEQKDADWLDEIRSRNGDGNFLVRDGSNILPAYSMNNPTKDANKAVKGMELHKENISIVMGLGLGYLVKAILNSMEKGHRVLVIEPVGHMIRLAFSNFDFAEAIRNLEMILIGPGKQEAIFGIHFMSNQFVVSNWLLTVNKYTNAKPDIYKELIDAASDAINQVMCNVGTVAGSAGGIIADNDISCLPWIIRHRGVAELKDLYKDKPAILVSTGPSLAKNIHHLIGLEDKAVIICVGQALRPLLSYNIRPDFCTTVDFGQTNYTHFCGLMDCNIPLVTINRTFGDLIRDWKGPKFIVATPVPGHEQRATGILSDKGFIEAGGSVAHLSLGLAKHLGCSPIVFIGQDLALGETSHIPLADAAGKITVNEQGLIDWRVDDQRCHLHGKGQVHGMGPVTYTESYFGGPPILTNMGLASFKTSMENMIESYLKGN